MTGVVYRVRLAQEQPPTTLMPSGLGLRAQARPHRQRQRARARPWWS